MKLWKRAGSLGLSLALCAGLVSPALAHKVTIGGVDQGDVDTVQEGVEKIGSGSGTIKMTGNDSTSVTIDKGNVTLDLSGHSITNNDRNGTVITVEGGVLTLQDSSGAGGKLEATDSLGKGLVVSGGTFHMEGGTVTGKSAGLDVYGGGIVHILGGTVMSEEGCSLWVDEQGTTVTISGGAVTGKTGVQVANNSTFTMDGGTVGSTVENGDAIVGSGTITLNGGTIYGSVPDGVVPGAGVTVEAAPYVPPAPTPTPAPDPAPASDPLTRPAAASTLLEELFRRAGGSGGLWTWAVENGLVDEDGDGDEIVTVALLRAILTRYAEAFGGNAVAVEDLTTLTGGDADVVDNCRAVLKEFFGE